MATLVQISGDPGTGKTYAVKQLTDKYPGQVYFINTDKKGLSWAGWRKEFGTDKKNYAPVSNAHEIAMIMKSVSEKRPDIKVLIVDTINTIMSDMEMEDMKKSGYDKWKDMATDIYELYNLAHNLREDLIVIFMAHIEPFEVDGETHWRTKTNGKKLTKMNLNGKLSYNLYTQVERDGEHSQYYFITQSNGKTEARSVEGVLDYKIPNDLGLVVGLIRERDLNID